MSQKQTISTNKILAGDVSQLKKLLSFIGSGSRFNGQAVEQDVLSEKQELSHEQLMLALDKLQGSDLDSSQSLAEALSWVNGDQQIALADDDLCWINFVDHLYTQFMHSCDLDDQMLALFFRLRVCFVKTMLLENDPVSNDQHALRLFLSTAVSFAQSWYAGLGRSGTIFYQQIESQIETLRTQFDTDSAVFEKQYQQFLEANDKEQQKVDRLEKRLFESEAGQIRARRAQHLVIELLNQTLAEQYLPPAVAEFLLDSWQNELRLFLIQNGQEAAQWQRSKKLIETLVASFRPARSEEERQRLYSVVPRLGDELQRYVAVVSQNPDQYSNVLNEIEALHIQILKGMEIPCIAVEALEMPDSLKGISTTVSASLIKKAQALQEGGWLLYRTEAGESIRCKLLAKIPDTDQLLFVNRNGLKVLQMGIEDMAYCLSAGIARQLREGDFFNSAWQQCVRAVLNEFEQRQEELQERKARRVEEERLREEQRVQAELDRKQQELRRIAAAGKAKAEALAIAKAKAEAEREAAEQAEQERQERAQQQLEERDRQRVEARKIARLSLDSISIGAWVEIPNADGEATKSKLAVKISSTKKYIFVDRNGLKVSQLLRDELIEMLVEGQAKILDLGENFEDRLAKVVEGLRRDKS